MGVGLYSFTNECISILWIKYIRIVYEYTKGKIPLIGVGGVDSAEKAYEKIKNGASVIQLYTGMVYQGPDIAQKISKELVEIVRNKGANNISELVGTKK